MTNKIKFVIVIIISAFLVSCSTESERNQDEELEQSTQVSEVDQFLIASLEKEKDLVLINYNKKDESARKGMNLAQYHNNLTIKYNSLIEQMKVGFESFDHTKDAETQVIELRESIMEKDNIPDWYVNFKIAEREALKEIIE
ncbi:MAG: hypothetical protein AAFQ94_16330 [Bacteroidota bacterium]